MRIDIISVGRFHLFDLARSLYDIGVDVRFITTVPKGRLKKHSNIKFNCISLPLEYFRVLTRLIPVECKFKLYIDFIIRRLFAKLACIVVRKSADVVIGIAESSLEIINYCNARDQLFILDRGSTHIDYHNNLMDKLYSDHGVKRSFCLEVDLQRRRMEYILADAILIPSQYVKRSFEIYNVRTPMVEVSYGCDLSLFRWKEKMYCQNDVLKICYTGALSIRKNIDFLLKLMKSDLSAKIHLNIAGGVEDNVRAIADNLFSLENVTYYGRLHQSKLPDVYNESQIFLFPSHDEGLAMVQVQAAACGLPLIATPNGGFSDWIERHNVGHVAADDQGMYESILKFIENPNLISELNIKLRSVRHELSWTRYAEGVSNHIERIISSRMDNKKQ